MSQLALYRKYRSADLNSIVGQDHITKTLEQSIQRDRISHAYLFTGPRGVGKTSVARILARRVNGLKASEDINAHLDIIEIDAASNRGVDEMRNLREKINSAPSNLKYKVYIIDEAHMLTREAFNALLKTLEEPPAHAIFILATTEAHKLPDTIISRTQRYDFRPFREDVIVEQLKRIARKEKIDITEGGLVAIAQLSGSGMRDAISMLDQLASNNEKIDEKSVQSYMGLSSNNQIATLLLQASQCDYNSVFATLNTLFAQGVEPSAFNGQLQRYLRSVLLGSSSTENISQDYALEALEILISYQPYFKLNIHPSLPLEIALTKITNINKPKPNSKSNKLDLVSKEFIQPPVKTKNTDSKLQSSKSATPSEPDKIDITSRCAKGLSIIKEHNNSLYALLHSGDAHIEGSKLVVGCRFQFHKQRIEEFRNREIIEKVMSRVCKIPIQLECRLKNSNVSKKIDSEEEIVSSAMAILGGEMVDG